MARHLRHGGEHALVAHAASRDLIRRHRGAPRGISILVRGAAGSRKRRNARREQRGGPADPRAHERASLRTRAEKVFERIRF
jgi:hypothetical protein